MDCGDEELFCFCRFSGLKITVLLFIVLSRFKFYSFFGHFFRFKLFFTYLNVFGQLFEKVEVDKPLASRSASAEIYVLGFRYRAPAKIDPRLLDVKHLFERGKEPPKVI